MMIEHFLTGMSKERDRRQKKREAESQALAEKKRMEEATRAAIREFYAQLHSKYQAGELPNKLDYELKSSGFILKNREKAAMLVEVSANGDEVIAKNAGGGVLAKAKISDEKALEGLWTRVGEETQSLVE